MPVSVNVILVLLGAALLIAAFSGDKAKFFNVELQMLKHRLARPSAFVIAMGAILFGALNENGLLKKLWATDATPTMSMQAPSDTGDTSAQSSQVKNSLDNPLSGRWVDDDGIAYEIVQDGESIYWSSDSPDAAKSMRAEGIVHGNTLSLVTETNDNSTGRAELTVNSAHNTIIGMIDDSKHGKIALHLRRR